MRVKLRDLGFNFLLALTALTLTLGAFEIALRFFLPQKLYRFPTGIFRNDPNTVFGLSPGFQGVLHNPEYITQIRINELGLRGPGLHPRAAGTLRILALGDSFVSAFNVEEADTFSSVAERGLLAALPGTSVEVINAGTPNYGTWHELRQFERLYPILKPDVAVLCVYVGNDLDNNLNPNEAVVRNGFLTDRQTRPGLLPYGVRSWLQRNSMLYVFLWNAWNHIRPIFGVDPSDNLKPEKDIVSLEAVPSVEKSYRITADLFAEFRSQSERLKVPFLVVLIPSEFQVYSEQFEGMVRKQGLDPASFDLDLPQQRWAEMAMSVGFPTLDLLPIFRAEASAKHLYMSLDGHLSVEGNRMAGEAIAKEILRLSPQLLRVNAS